MIDTYVLNKGGMACAARQIACWVARENASAFIGARLRLVF
jgi:hypothetical protein